MMPIVFASPDTSERSRLLSIDMIRRRALDRLYRRKAAVETLIRSLEDYQDVRSSQISVPVEFSAVRKWS
ncbi:hypothetical protein SBA3_2030005 [Candidatus Sulfopaludibacter sp. SbA3]|nr:hypothetical protein SBA3_2030005 [Candidatus Sulfopaludibacter sp. SbA3]